PSLARLQAPRFARALPTLTLSKPEPAVFYGAAETDLGHLGPVVFADHEHFAPAPVVAAHRLLRYRERMGIDPLLDLNADIHAGQQRQLRIGKLAAQRHLTGAGIDRGVGEQQLAIVGIDLTVVEDKAHPRRRAMLKRAGLEF